MTKWQERAACSGVPTDVIDWYSSNADVKQKARTICQLECPVRRECIEFALENQYIWGVWGGVDEFELRRALASDQFGEPDCARTRSPRCPFCLSRDLKIGGGRTKRGYKTTCNECELTWRMMCVPDKLKVKK